MTGGQPLGRGGFHCGYIGSLSVRGQKVTSNADYGKRWEGLIAAIEFKP